MSVSPWKTLCGHELTAALVTETRSNQQDQSVRSQQAALIAINGCWKKITEEEAMKGGKVCRDKEEKERVNEGEYDQDTWFTYMKFSQVKLKVLCFKKENIAW